jgi:hypothetical protein
MTGDDINRTFRRRGAKPLEPANRRSALSPDWAAAATEARRQRDDAEKRERAERNQQRRQVRAATHAWSPQHEISRHR